MAISTSTDLEPELAALVLARLAAVYAPRRWIR